MKINNLFKKIKYNTIYFFLIIIIFIIITYNLLKSFNKEGLNEPTTCEPSIELDRIKKIIDYTTNSDLSEGFKKTTRNFVKGYSESSDIIKKYLLDCINDINKNIDCSGNELEPVKYGDFINHLDTCLSKLIDIFDSIQLIKTKKSLKKILLKL
tara:strand:- start:1033 stop:1494 length:462 start_codon:yes stop_codon:yes gene_type:complete